MKFLQNGLFLFVPCWESNYKFWTLGSFLIKCKDFNFIFISGFSCFQFFVYANTFQISVLFFFFKCYDIGFLPFPFSDFMWYISNSNLFLLFHYFTPVFTHYFFLKFTNFFLSCSMQNLWIFRIPKSGIELMPPPAVGQQSLYHWITREILTRYFLFFFYRLFCFFIYLL